MSTRNSSHQDHVAVTGVGWVTPYAAGGMSEVLEAHRAGAAEQLVGDEPAMGSHWEVPDGFRDKAGKISNEIKREKAAWITALAINACLETAGISHDSWSPERVGLVISSTQAGPIGMIRFANEVRGQTARFVSPIHFPQTVGNFVSGAIARFYHVRGPNMTIAKPSAIGGLDAIVEGCGLLRARHADRVLVGGVDTWSDEVASGLGTANLTEGACFLLLERLTDIAERADRILATLSGAPLAADPRATIDACTVIPGDRTDAAVISTTDVVGMCPSTCGLAAAAMAIGLQQGMLLKTDGAAARTDMSGDESLLITGPTPSFALRFFAPTL
ncbi:MAG: beta-ketoacyl synthase N-terminal-like domain-containing protein [Planctomycetota bacterium]|jgi:3-oxoacyl-(acyl-carrier-protein) synthase